MEGLSDLTVMNSNQLKEKGNALIKEGQYEEAVNCYTAALKSDPSNHTILSNRSLAYFKLGKFKEALDDANKCINVAPKFGRGYLRKATVLNSLNMESDAMLASEEGYKCRQSDLVCKECISQWLVANQTVHKELIDKATNSFGVPTGFLILSENVYIILEKLSFARVTTAMITQKLMTEYLLDVAKEMDSLLSKFGHKTPSAMLQWIHGLSLAFAVNPQTDSIPKEVAHQIVEKGSEFSSSFVTSIDSILYPLLCPLVVLCVMIVNDRAYSLDCMNSGHQERQAICESLLPLFKCGILKSELYVVPHLCTLSGLLNSFHGRRTQLTDENVHDVTKYSQQMMMVLPKLTPTVWEYEELKENCLSTLAVVKEDTNVGHGSVYVTGGVKVEASAMFGSVSSSTIVSSVEQYMEDIKKKKPEHFTIDDAEYLLYGSYALADIGQNEPAIASFEVGQFLYFQMFTLWMTIGLWSLDEMGSIIAGPRNIILEVAAKLAPVNSELFVNAIVRWKSLYTEFNILLIGIGLRNSYLKTYSDVLKLQKKGKNMDQKSVLQIAAKHKEEADKLAKQFGPTALSIIFRHCYQPIQKLIDDDEIVLDYCYLYTSELLTDDTCKSKLGIQCGIVVIKSKGNPLSLIVDFSNFNSLVKEWLKQLQTSGPPESASISHQLCDILFPPQIREVLEDSKIKRVFLCPDLSMAQLPLDLILFPDNKMLYQKCAVTLLSSSRETLRGSSSAILDEKVKLSPAGENIPAIENPIIASKSNKCIIFASPDFDLETLHPSSSSSIVHLINEVLGVLHISIPVRQIESLPSSEEEADNIEYILSTNKNTTLLVEKVTGDKATIMAALRVQSPLLLHFATHAFAPVQDHTPQLFGGNFWANTSSGLVLAGANTFLSGKYDRVSEDAGTGQLTGLAVCAMNLKNTRLVYLSACSSSSGHLISGESPMNLAQAFRAAGAQSVIATLWTVSDVASSKFSSLFYYFLCQRGVRPSEALVSAKNSMQADPEFNHWRHWAPYVCIGCDFPLFLNY